MAIVAKAFQAVRPGDVYPSEIAPGEEVSGSLEDAARALGCLVPEPDRRKGKALKGAPENKAG